MVVPETVANDAFANDAGFNIVPFSSYPKTPAPDGDFKTLLAEHAFALGVLTETSLAARLTRTISTSLMNRT